MHARVCARMHPRLRVARRAYSCTLIHAFWRPFAIRSIRVALTFAHLHLHTCETHTHTYMDTRTHICIRMSDWKYVVQGASAVCGNPIHKLAADRATNYSDRTCFKSWTVMIDSRGLSRRKENQVVPALLS